jgi:hypothetical protein
LLHGDARWNGISGIAVLGVPRHGSASNP